MGFSVIPIVSVNLGANHSPTAGGRMPIEKASAVVVRKPWGRADLRPWSDNYEGDGLVGELWFQRSIGNDREAALLLKLLFTDMPLSIQVHPDDVYARSIGLPNGKTEAWYVLSATGTAKVALGFQENIKPVELRRSIEDGTVIDRIQWRSVEKGETIFVPAGTVHSIGAGLVIAEIQQRSDATFRIFDFGRDRKLDVDHAMSVADAGPVRLQLPPRRLSNERVLLAACPHFVLERLELAKNASWMLRAEFEAWMLVIEGDAWIGPVRVSVGDVVFLEGDTAEVQTGRNGLLALFAYSADKPSDDLLKKRH
jgi:mannose-6-phosphate isomerase